MRTIKNNVPFALTGKIPIKVKFHRRGGAFDIRDASGRWHHELFQFPDGLDLAQIINAAQTINPRLR